MRGNAYRLLGFLVWRGGRWYLRRRLPSRRQLMMRGLLGASVLVVAGTILVRRAAG